MTAPYHHGSLRETLLAEARRLLLEDGPDAVTLRGLAKRAGVSHGAPLRHFASRDELMDAIAAEGFTELTDCLAAAEQIDDLQARMSTYAHAHVRFAMDNGPLMQLMFTGRPGSSGALTAQASGRFFALGARMLGEPGDPGRPGPLPFLLAGTLEGISALVGTGRLPADQVDDVIDAAVQMLLPAIEGQLHDVTPSTPCTH